MQVLNHHLIIKTRLASLGSVALSTGTMVAYRIALGTRTGTNVQPIPCVGVIHCSLLALLSVTVFE